MQIWIRLFAQDPDRLHKEKKYQYRTKQILFRKSTVLIFHFFLAEELETFLDPMFGEHLVQTDRVKQSIVLSQEATIERDLALLAQVVAPGFSVSDPYSFDTDQDPIVLSEEATIERDLALLAQVVHAD